MFKLYLLLLNLSITISLFAQNQLISPFLGDVTPNQPATNYLMQQPETADVEYVNLNLNTLNNATNLQLKFDNLNYTVTNDSIALQGPQNYTWFGTNTTGDGYIIISVLGDDVQGIIRKGLETYELLTTAASQRKVIVKIDQSQYQQELCEFDSAIIDKTQENNGEELTNKSILKKALDTGCPIRVLVMYTPAAEADITGGGVMISDIKNAIQNTVEEMNNTFKESEITNYPAVEIALIQKWDYEEFSEFSDTIMVTDMAVDLNIFKEDSYVNRLRNDYDADFCTLIAAGSDFYGFCGVANDLRATTSTAYCLVANNCMRRNLSFAHELGHLLSAHHDVANARNEPFPYAHGYIYFPGRWRTIMSYNSLPCDSTRENRCARLPFWSNPDVNHPTDNVPMGTDSLENNARVLRDYNNNLAGIEQPENNITLSNSTYHSTNNIFTNLEIKQTITTNGNVVVQDDACFYLKAGESVNLNNGFESKPKADVEITIQQIEDCQ